MAKRLIGMVLVTAGLWSVAQADQRQLQIRHIDLERRIITLFNFNNYDEPLDGYAFCSSDDNKVRRYTHPTGLNGYVIEARSEFHFHLNNDAPPGVANAINQQDLIGPMGSFAMPLDQGPYALSWYFPPIIFSNGDTMADHCQWNVDGADDTTADERSDEAVNGGVWNDEEAWLATPPSTPAIQLCELSGAELHGPDDYIVVRCTGDISGNVSVPDCKVDVFDLLAVMDQWGTCNAPCPDGELATPYLCSYDINLDCVVNVFDVIELLSHWGGCD